MPKLFDLTFKSSAAQEDLPTDVYPYLGPAVYRGEPYDIAFTLLDGEDPYEPEGDLRAQIRTARLGAGVTPGEPLAEFAVSVLVNVVTISLTAAQTRALPDAGFWDLEEYDEVDGPLRTWFTGKVKVWGDVSREDAA